MVFSQGWAFHAQNALRGPCINLYLAKHHAIPVSLEGDFLFFDQPIEISRGKMQVACGFIRTKGSVGHEAINGSALGRVDWPTRLCP
jgi:hypothetical protein